MTADHAIALSLIPDLPRTGLTARLQADDPDLVERAIPLLPTARRTVDRARAEGIQAVAWNEAAYPPALLAIPDTAPALWYRGHLQSLDAPAVAIVGSRSASAVALETARRLAEDLAASGVTVVSGLARGVDSAAHRGALRAGGHTVAVLGSGVDRVYPREHAALADEIAQRGLVVSEFAPGVPPLPFHFPLRNRLISGLSRAVVVIEASERSGSLITAACALEQGREVMAVPGNVLSGRNRGGHALIRDGATIVETAEDVLTELMLPLRGDTGAAASGNGEVTRATATGWNDALLARMTPGDAYDLDALASASGLDAARLLPRLLALELAGHIRRVGAGRFIRQQ